jgi:hypothetical protein
MPTYLVIEKSYSNNEEIFGYLSQTNLEDLLSGLRRFYHRSSDFTIYELRVTEVGQFDPPNCVPLGVVAKLEARDKVTLFSNKWGSYIDELPKEQFEIELTRMSDYLEQKRLLLRQRFQPQEATPDVEKQQTPTS